MNNLHSSWVRAWAGIGARTYGQEVFESLIQSYGEAHRKYHSVQHLTECLALFDSVQTLPERASEVELALWFHDAIYDVKATDNEEKSADWAKSAALQGGASTEVAGRLHSLVMATKHTAIPDGVDEQVLIDIDLSILGSGPARFAEYEQQIRSEYAFVPDELFHKKRQSILQSFLDRKRIYSTGHFQELLEARARENLYRATGKNTLTTLPSKLD